MNQSIIHNLRRFLAFLAFALGLSLCAQAEDVEIDGLYYELNTSTRTATITYQSTTTSNYASLPANLVVPASVTYNGVTFSVTKIADRAFANCTKLESISIPNTVKQIGTANNQMTTTTTPTYLPFYNCTSLKTVRFEDGTDPVALGSNCYSYGSYQYDGYGLFYSCPLEEVYLGRNITYSEASNIKFTDSPRNYGYSAFCNRQKLTKVTIGENVTSIPAYLFRSASNLATLEILGNLDRIPGHAFENCSSLKSALLPSSVTSVGAYAFYECSALETLTLGSATEIGDYAFYNTATLSQITFPQNLNSIGAYAFAQTGIKDIVIPSSVSSISNNAFEASKVQTLNLGSGSLTLGNEVFENCQNLKKVTVGHGVETIPSSCFNNCASLQEVSLESGIQTISDKAFAGCTSLESISIPNTVKQIGTANNQMTTTTTPTYLPFYNCTSLKTVRFEDGTDPVALGSNCYSYGSSRYTGYGLFYSCPLEEVYIGRNITYAEASDVKFVYNLQSYGYSAFYNQPKLTKVTIGQTVSEISAYLFYKNASITLMTLPNVEKIGAAAFRECTKLTTLNLGNALTSVGDEAFYGCSNITKLTFPNTTQSIGARAFYNCSSVTEVTVGTGLRSVGEYGFYCCKSFTALILPDEFTTMGESAFESCTKLTVAKLGSSLTALPARAFKDCTSLSEMVVPASAESIGDQALYNDSSLATITLNDGLKTIGNEVFWNNSGILRFTIPGTVTSIGSNCFYGCTNVSYLIFSDGDENLKINNKSCRSSIIEAQTSNSNYRNRNYDYFYDCPVRFLTLGRNLVYEYDDNASMYDPDGTSWTRVYRASAPFVNKKELRSVTIRPKVRFLYHHLLNGCSNIARLTFVPALETVYSYALANCTGLKDLDLSTGLKTVGNYGFYNCPLLTTLSFPEPFVSLGSYGCADNTALRDVVFKEESGNNLSMTLETYAFANCPSITALVFPAKTSSIGNYCFYNTPYIVDVKFVDSNRPLKLGYGAKADDSMGINTDSSMPLFGNSRLQKLYIGRNIDYTASSGNGYSPFYQQTLLTDVTFSQAGTVTYCKDYLLYNVSACENLNLPESITELGKYTFAGMTALKGIFIPTKVSWLKEGLFAEDVNIPEIIIHPAVTKMDSKLFANCRSLATVTFEGSADLIEMAYGASRGDYGLFRDCPLETLNLDRWLSYNSDEASRSPFYSIATLKNLNFGPNVGVVDKYMFSYCTGLEEVWLPDNIESVGLWGFRGCSALKSVRFSEKLSQVSDYGFSECTSLDNVVFPESMTSIADNSFSNCTSLKKLDLGSKLMIIGPSAFKNDTALEGVELPESLYGLGVEAFANCSSLPSVKIQGISSVGKQAFENCTGLKWVSLSDKTTSLGENSFAGCSGISYVKSFAEFPPEGLVNFVESVPANGTLFVPEYSVDYYQYSPTWETWLDIRPLNDNVMVSSVELNQSEFSFRAAETVQLTATVGADDATDKSIIWRSSNPEIATVDADGLVTAVAVGEATVTALAADGSGSRAECLVTVNPTLVESISISSGAETLKKGRELALSASVLPASATDASLSWASSNPDVASVESDGLVSAKTVGEVTITATANDGSGISSSFVLTVVPPTLGDANDNDAVTITDAVHTANYAVGIEVENFCLEAADINADGRISLADASGIVSIVLEQPEPENRPRAIAMDSDNNTDALVIDDFCLRKGASATVAVRLDDSREYVALQGDIVAPDGMKIVDVKAGPRAEATHTAAVRRFDSGTVRFALFDLENNPFADNGEAVLVFTVVAEDDFRGQISIANILGADASAREYSLKAVGGNNSGLTGVDSVASGHVTVEAGEGEITVRNAEGLEVFIFAPDGMNVAHFTAKTDAEHCHMVPGVYVVTAGDFSAKVMVK